MPEFQFNPQNLIDTATGGILGLMLGGINDNRQYKQAARLQKLQIAGQKELTDYNMGKQFQMWLDTNYPAQVEQINKAGMNPALLYGMKGGGGITTGSATGSVSGHQAPVGGREIQDMIGMGMQLKLLQAQQRVLETQADKNAADAAFTSGAGTEQATAQTQLLAQELDNRREDFQIKRLQQTMMHIENFEKQTSQEDRLTQIEAAAATAMRQLNIIANQETISNATVQEQIKIIQQTAIGAILHNEATQNNIQLTKAQIDKITQEIIASQRQLSFQELETMFKTNFPSLGQTAGRIFNDAIEAIYKLTTGKRTPHNQPKQ